MTSNLSFFLKKHTHYSKPQLPPTQTHSTLYISQTWDSCLVGLVRPRRNWGEPSLPEKETLRRRRQRTMMSQKAIFQSMLEKCTEGLWSQSAISTTLCSKNCCIWPRKSSDTIIQWEASQFHAMKTTFSPSPLSSTHHTHRWHFPSDQ